MNEDRIINNIKITIKPGWLDITNELDTKNAPFTLAREEGFGALQFSIASYVSGMLPKICINDLKILLTNFSMSHQLGQGFDSKPSEKPILVFAESYESKQQYIRVWYCSNGKDVVLITYVCEFGLEKHELPDCEEMISTLRFVDNTNMN